MIDYLLIFYTSDEKKKILEGIQEERDDYTQRQEISENLKVNTNFANSFQVLKKGHLFLVVSHFLRKIHGLGHIYRLSLSDEFVKQS